MTSDRRLEGLFDGLGDGFKLRGNGGSESRLTGEGASQYHSRAPRGLSVSMPLRPPT